VVDETPGVELVKIDVDANPRSAQTFQVQSIPAVFAIKDRKVLDSFIGALPEPAVRQWVAGLTPMPTEAERLVAAGDEASLRKALELEPANEKAILGLAGLLVGDRADPAAREEALALLARLPETAETRHLAAQARLGTAAEVGSGSDGVEAKLDELLERVRGDESARQEFVDLLEVLGPDDPRTATYRRALTAKLF
jgi:putative thioredoxin